MIVLFNNLIYDSTISSDTVDANYPVTNLQNDEPSKIYKANQASAVITLTLADISTINCLYLANTNATGASLGLYNASNTLLDTQTVDVDRGGACFTSVTDVSYMILTLSGSDTIYLGCIGTGAKYQMPNPLNDVLPLPIDNTTRKISPSGTGFFNRVPIQISLSTNFANITRTLYNEIFNLWASLAHPVWVDVREDYDGIINPMFADMTMDKTPTHKYKRDAMTFNFQEMK